jgi:hypothetical protein
MVARIHGNIEGVVSVRGFSDRVSTRAMLIMVAAVAWSG